MKEIWSGDELDELVMREWKEVVVEKRGIKKDARAADMSLAQSGRGKEAGQRRGVLAVEAQGLRLGNATFRRR